MTGDSKSEAILEAALVLFAPQGFGGTAMPAVPARARAGVGTIYRYFAAQEALGKAVFRRWKTVLAGVMAEALAAPGTAEGRFLAGWRGAVAFARAQPLAAALAWGALVGLVKAASAGAVALDDAAISQSGRLMWRALAGNGGGR